MLALAALIAQSALAQSFTSDNAILGVSNLNWPGYVNTTMGSPAIAHDNFTVSFFGFPVPLDYTLMFYETQVGPPTAGCPAGKWGIGLARRLSYILGTTWLDRGPIIEPGDVSYASCVAAHPAVVRISDSPPTWVVYFKAEQDTVACPTCDRYPGVGRFVFQRSNVLGTNISTYFSYSAPDPTPVMTTVAEEMGYPSVVFADGEYHMAFAQDADVYVASSFNTASFVAPPTPALTPGSSAGGWDGEQLFSPSLVCQGPSDFELYVGGRTFDAYPGVLDQALGLYTTPDLVTYTEDLSSPLFSVLDGDRQMRHLEMTTSNAGAQYGLFYTTPASIGNQVRLAQTAGFSYAQLDAKRCP